MEDKKFKLKGNGPYEMNKYMEIIPTGFSSWIDEYPSILAFQIINNIRTVQYNYDYKCHQEISLLSILLFDRSPVYRAIDRVISSIDLTQIDKKVEDEEYEYVYSKKSLARLVLSSHRKLIVVNPEDIEKAKFYNSMKAYLNVICRYIRIKSNKIINNLLKLTLEVK